VSSSFRKNRVVKRYASSGEYVNGNFVPVGSPVTFLIMASQQPLTGRELEALPEGRRNSDSYSLFTDYPLVTAEVSKVNNPDIVMINNEEFEVIKVESWQNDVINHYKATVVKRDQ